jgi:hypothetical protein
MGAGFVSVIRTPPDSTIEAGRYFIRDIVDDVRTNDLQVSPSIAAAPILWVPGIRICHHPPGQCTQAHKTLKLSSKVIDPD